MIKKRVPCSLNELLLLSLDTYFCYKFTEFLRILFYDYWCRSFSILNLICYLVKKHTNNLFYQHQQSHQIFYAFSYFLRLQKLFIDLFRCRIEFSHWNKSRVSINEVKILLSFFCNVERKEFYLLKTRGTRTPNISFGN